MSEGEISLETLRRARDALNAQEPVHWPRFAVFRRDDGTDWIVRVRHDQPPEIAQIVDGRVGQYRRLEPVDVPDWAWSLP